MFVIRPNDVGLVIMNISPSSFIYMWSDPFAVLAIVSNFSSKVICLVLLDQKSCSKWIKSFKIMPVLFLLTNMYGLLLYTFKSLRDPLKRPHVRSLI